jgi:hypothetical protein
MVARVESLNGHVTLSLSKRGGGVLGGIEIGSRAYVAGTLIDRNQIAHLRNALAALDAVLASPSDSPRKVTSS